MSTIYRKANLDDQEKLICFFSEAYGSNSALANKEYLNWFFFNDGKPYQNNWIALIDNKIVSHYGIIKTEFQFNEQEFDIYFGVNSFTLPNYRGKSISSIIFNQLKSDIPNLVVIGFSKKTKEFYKKNSFNLHEDRRFERFVKVTNYENLSSLCSIKLEDTLQEVINDDYSHKNNMVRITLSNLYDFEFDLDYFVLTTKRDASYIKNRFLNSPFSNYKIFAFKNGKSLTSLVVIKIEYVNKTNYCIRIVDVFGIKQEIIRLLNFIEHKVITDNCLFIDYIFFNNIYDYCFKSLNYIYLKDDSFSLVPFLTNPLVITENTEYFGIQSKTMNIHNYDFYLTKMNSDRDRLNKI